MKINQIATAETFPWNLSREKLKQSVADFMPRILEAYASSEREELIKNAALPGAPHVKLTAKKIAPEGLQLTFNQDFDEIEPEIATITIADDPDKGAWNINDRQTMPRYQKYGFFPALVNACELFVQEMAERRKTQQMIEVDVSQPRVLSAFERQGYVLKEGHEENAERVRHPEQYPQEVVTEFPYTPSSRNGEQIINTMRDPQVFLKSVWDEKMQGAVKPTIYDSLRVSLTKLISPTRIAIGKVVEDTAGEIAGISPSLLKSEVNTRPDESFTDVVIKGLSENKQIILEKVCDDTQSHPVVLVRSQSFDPSKPTVFLSAGMHGDEPAGVHAIIRFLNTDLHRYIDRFNIVALPCLNPSGFDAGMHNTSSGMNINDYFGKQSNDAVVQAIEAKIKPLAPSVVLSFDLHEDNSGDQLGCYVYEAVSKATGRMAHQVLEALSPTDICKTPEIYGAKNTEGVIEEDMDESPESLGGLHGYLKTQGARNAMVIETPSAWSFEKRVQTHLAMINRGLEKVDPAHQSFADSLRPTDFDVGNVHIWQLENDPSTLVRESKIGDGETLDALESSIHEGETLFEEMRAKYGIRVVSMKARRERNKEGKETIFTLVDKIEGKNLSKIESLPIEARDELEALYLSLGQYYYDAWKQGLKYWGDCRSDQFVYGNKYGEKDKHFFAVDVDPQFYREGDDKFRTIEAALGSLCGELVENERKFQPRIRLQAARDRLLGIIDEILKKEPELKMIIEAKTWLQDTR